MQAGRGDKVSPLRPATLAPVETTEISVVRNLGSSRSNSAATRSYTRQLARCGASRRPIPTRAIPWFRRRVGESDRAIDSSHDCAGIEVENILVGAIADEDGRPVAEDARSHSPFGPVMARRPGGRGEQQVDALELRFRRSGGSSTCRRRRRSRSDRCLRPPAPCCGHPASTRIPNPSASAFTLRCRPRHRPVRREQDHAVEQTRRLELRPPACQAPETPWSPLASCRAQSNSAVCPLGDPVGADEVAKPVAAHGEFRRHDQPASAAAACLTAWSMAALFASISPGRGAR